MTLDEGHYYIFTFCCDNLWNSKFMALEKPGKLWNFFLVLRGHPAIHVLCIFSINCCLSRCCIIVFFMFCAVLLLSVLNWNFASARHVVMVGCVCQLLNFQQFILFCCTGRQWHVYALSVCFNFWFLLFMLFARCFCIDSKCTALLFFRLRPTQ